MDSPERRVEVGGEHKCILPKEGGGGENVFFWNKILTSIKHHVFIFTNYSPLDDFIYKERGKGGQLDTTALV